MVRRDILNRVRAALGRSGSQPTPEPPPAWLHIPEVDLETRIASMTARLQALGGRVCRVPGPAAAAWVREELGPRTAIASNAPYLLECGITQLAGVRSGIADGQQLRQICANADVGITSADYALADTGSLVMLSSPREARLISMLPPAHIAVLPCIRLLTGLDELFAVLPDPAATASSMVLITGPSRTADIEQILVRGVHGPGQVSVILVG